MMQHVGNVTHCMDLLLRSQSKACKANLRLLIYDEDHPLF